MSYTKLKKFDSYKIVRFIKSGGMASVYEGVDSRTKERVAIKIMSDGLSKQKDLAEKFLREGDILEKLQNENRSLNDYPIVKIFRHSRENNDPSGTAFLALEYLQGVDLQDLLVKIKNRGLTISVDDSVKIILSVAKALKLVHSRNVWHRDLSPDNIFLTVERVESIPRSNGSLHFEQDSFIDKINIKLIDFGVAKFEFMSHDSLGGALFGKPPYMSPEQCNSLPSDKRSDQYSLGMIFYTLLVGEPPFQGDNPLEVIKKHIEEPIPELPAKVPDKITNIIYKMARKDSDERYENIDQLIFELEDYLDENEKSLERSSNSVYQIIIDESKNTGGGRSSKKKPSSNKVSLLNNLKFNPKFIIYPLLLGGLIVAFYMLFTQVIFSDSENMLNLKVQSTDNFISKKQLAKYEGDYYLEVVFANKLKEADDKISFLINSNQIDYYEFSLTQQGVTLSQKLFGDNSEIYSAFNTSKQSTEVLEVHYVNNRLFIYLNDIGIIEKKIDDKIKNKKGEISISQKGNMLVDYGVTINEL